MPSPDPVQLCALAEALAREAGQLLLARPDVLAVQAKTTPTDAVTQMDRAAERLIIDGIATARPGDGVLGEESGETPSRSGVRWVVDPLDGTVNYLYGIPHYAVSIAAEVAGVVVAGVVHDPEKRETYTAVRGGGAWCNGSRLRCRRGADLAQSLVATGFGYAANRRAEQARVLATVLPAVRDIRRFGAAALDLCAVAAGRVDGFYERGMNAWDLAAGGLIAQEAGARVEGLHGVPAGPALAIAAAPAVFGPLHDLLAGSGADRG